MVNFENEIIAALKKYEYLADNALNGKFSRVSCKAVENEDGVFDGNWENRKRLVAVITSIRPDAVNENVVKNLFAAEVQSCRINSFGGYDDTLLTLTSMLWKFNTDGRYDKLFEEAKNANFDCECGYDPNKKIPYYQGIDFIKKLSPGDCANYLYFDLYDTDNIEKILDLIEQEYCDNIDELEKISYLNKCLSRKSHNYKLLLLKLENVLKDGTEWDISSAYSLVIDSIIETDTKQAYDHFEKALPYLFKVDEWYGCGLGREYVMFAADFIAMIPDLREKLWEKWGTYIISNCDNSSLGKICSKAAEIMGCADIPEIK